MISPVRASLLALALAFVCACKSDPAPAPIAARAHAGSCLAGDKDACVPACFEGDQASCTEAIDARRADAWRQAPSEKLFWDLLDRACTLGDAARCEELARDVLGRDEARALAAYERYCASPDAVEADCVSTRKRWIAGVEAARPRCEAGEIEACVELGERLLAAESHDNAAEAFARACELRGFDVEAIFPEVPMLDCNTGVPYHGRRDHPGARGRCGVLTAFKAAVLGGSAASNFKGYVDAGVEEAGTMSALPPPGKGPPAEVRIGAPRLLGGDYPAEALSSRLEPLKARFSSCAGAAPEARGAYTFDVQLKIDRSGKPAFFDYFPRSGVVDGAVWRVIWCVGDLLKEVTYAPPPSGKGVAVQVLFSVDPRVTERK